VFNHVHFVTLCDYLIWFTVTGTRPDDEVSHEFVIWDEIFSAYKFCCNWPSLTMLDNWSPDRNWKQWANLPESNSSSRPRTGTWFVIFYWNISIPFEKFNMLCFLSFYLPLFFEKLGLFNTRKKRLSKKLIHDRYILFDIFLFTLIYIVKWVFTFLYHGQRW